MTEGTHWSLVELRDQDAMGQVGRLWEWSEPGFHITDAPRNGTEEERAVTGNTQSSLLEDVSASPLKLEPEIQLLGFAVSSAFVSLNNGSTSLGKKDKITLRMGHHEENRSSQGLPSGGLSLFPQGLEGQLFFDLRNLPRTD